MNPQDKSLQGANDTEIVVGPTGTPGAEIKLRINMGGQHEQSMSVLLSHSQANRMAAIISMMVTQTTGSTQGGKA